MHGPLNVKLECQNDKGTERSARQPMGDGSHMGVLVMGKQKKVSMRKRG